MIHFSPYTSSSKQATAIGRNFETVRDYLEKHYKKDFTQQEAIDLAMKALLEVVDTGTKNLELCVIEPGKGLRLLPDAEVTSCIERVEGEKKQEEAERKKKVMKAD